jgi:release factor glutamine methyltransferase
MSSSIELIGNSYTLQRSKIMERATNSKVLFQSLVKAITLDEAREEIESIAFTLLRGRTGLSRGEILTARETWVTVADLADDINRINSQEPVQYVVGTAEFYRREFLVNPSVLIPRPETEVLVSSALNHQKHLRDSCRILDIGTGSGCIAVTLALESPSSVVTAIDVSEDALKIALKNSERLGAKVNFQKHDFLQTALPEGKWELIVSNPPYVMDKEAHLMKANVTRFEPHLALFVPDDNPLLFYEAIARKGKDLLTDDGAVIVEINEKMGKETADLFLSYGYLAAVIKDLDGKDRIVVANLKHR